MGRDEQPPGRSRRLVRRLFSVAPRSAHGRAMQGKVFRSVPHAIGGMSIPYSWKACKIIPDGVRCGNLPLASLP